jgi:hypothetical protein
MRRTLTLATRTSWFLLFAALLVQVLSLFGALQYVGQLWHRRLSYFTTGLGIHFSVAVLLSPEAASTVSVFRPVSVPHYYLWGFGIGVDPRLRAAEAADLSRSTSMIRILNDRLAVEPPGSTRATLQSRISQLQQEGGLKQTYFEMMLPHWFVILLCGILPLYDRLVERRQRLRRQRGLCVQCGYDLRASPGRCPECGAAAASPAVAVD